MQRAIIIITLILLSFGIKAQVYQAMPQAGYGPVKRMLFDSVLTIPLNINQLRNITGGRDAGQIRYNVTDSGLYVYSGYQWIKANLDSSNISNRINGKLNVSDTAQMLSVYLRKLDTASLSNRINLRVKYSDTAQMLSVYLRKLDTASLSNRIDAKQNAITLTTNFKSGAATLVGATLNIPKYSDTLTAYVPYVGAIKDVDLGVYKLNANTLQSDYLLQVKNSPTSIAPTKDYTAITGMESGLVLYSSWMTGNTTYTQQNFINYANTNLQNNTRQYNLPVRDGTLALVQDTVNLSSRINLKADKATTLTINGQTYDLSSNRTWNIPVVDTTSLSNRLNLKLNISDTAAMLSPYLRKADTSSLSNRIDLRVKYSDTASMLSGYLTAINSKLNPSDTVSLSNRINTKQGLITLTTNNNSGVATFISNVLNIPNYTIDVSGFVPYTGANQNVNLGVYDLTADVVNGTKGSFTSNGSANTFDISHTSGSGIGLNITKGGNGEGLYINKTSGSGNAATIIGTLNATKLVKSGGTSSQFLKADGSVDSNIYISDTTSLSNRINLKLNATDTASLSNRINAKADALSGTTNTVAKFTSSSTIGNSNIKDDGNAVSISTTAGSNGALQVGSYAGNILMNTNNSTGGLIFKNTSSSNKLWDISSFNNDLNFNESNISPTVMTLKAGGDVLISSLIGSGTRMVVASSTGVLSTQAISSDTTSLSNRINLKLNISDTASMLSGYKSAINSKQAQINGTGFVKASGTTISYDNSTYYLASNPNGYTTNTGTVTSVATGLGLSGGTITTSGTLLVDTASASILSRQRAANTYYLASNPNGYTSNTGTVTSVAALSLGTSGTDLSSTVANGTTTPVITLNVPTASATNRGALSSADWTTFNNKQNALTNPVTGSGTTNYLPKFTGASTIGNSNLINDASGNLGLGVTPSAWSAITALELANGVSIASYSAAAIPNSYLTNNAFFNGSNWIYKVSSFAATMQTQTSGGNYAWSIAPSGTAGNAISFTQAMTLNASGNLSIGNTNDSYKLDVNGTGRFSASQVDILLNSSSTSQYSRLVYLENGAEKGGVQYINSAFSTTARRNKLEIFNSGGIAFITQGAFASPDLLIASTGAATFSGNVGIGGSPNNGLIDGLVIGNGTDNKGLTFFGTSTTQQNIAFTDIANTQQGLIQYDHGGDYLRFFTSSTEKVRITSGGNVGIGTTSPSTYLHVQGNNTSGRGQLSIQSSNASNAALATWYYNTTKQGEIGTTGGDFYALAVNNFLFYAGDAERMRITSGGNVGIGRTPTTNILEINGDASKTTAGLWAANSDSTIKTEINTIDSALERINKVRLVSFKYKDEYKLLNPSIKDKFYQNVIAQEFQKIYPDYVYQSGDTFQGKNVLQVDTNPMYIDAIASIQELSKLVKELSAKNEALIKRIETLENK